MERRPSQPKPPHQIPSKNQQKSDEDNLVDVNERVLKLMKAGTASRKPVDVVMLECVVKRGGAWVPSQIQDWAAAVTDSRQYSCL